MSSATEQIIDFVVLADPDFTKLNNTDMRWDGSGPTTGYILNPTLTVDGSPANPVSQVIQVSDVLELAE